MCLLSCFGLKEHLAQVVRHVPKIEVQEVVKHVPKIEAPTYPTYPMVICGPSTFRLFSDKNGKGCPNSLARSCQVQLQERIVEHPQVHQVDIWQQMGF